MILEGVISNVTHFGAFVDIGVHQDGLVHISALADKFVKDPHEVVSTGDVVKVKVIEIDEKRKRIALTMKLSDKAEPKSSTANIAHKTGANKKPSGGNSSSRQNNKHRQPQKEQEKAMGSLGAALLQAKQKSRQ